jgi:hypothetical protein
MTLYRISSIFLVMSAFCLAASVGLGSGFHTVISTICILMSAHLFAKGVEQETGAPNWHV